MNYSGPSSTNLGEIGNKFVKLVSLLLVSMQVSVKSYGESSDEFSNFTESCDISEDGESQSSKSKETLAKKKPTVKEEKKPVEKRENVASEVPIIENSIPLEKELPILDSSPSTDDNKIFSIHINASKCSEEAEKLASQLVYILTPNDLETNQLGEILNSLGHISKELLGLASQSEIRSLLTRLTDSTQDMLAEGIFFFFKELKKSLFCN